MRCYLLFNQRATWVYSGPGHGSKIEGPDGERLVGLGEVGPGDDEVGAEHGTCGETEAGWEGIASHRLRTVVNDKVRSRDGGEDFKFALHVRELFGSWSRK